MPQLVSQTGREPDQATDTRRRYPRRPYPTGPLFIATLTVSHYVNEKRLAYPATRHRAQDLGIRSGYGSKPNAFTMRAVPRMRNTTIVRKSFNSANCTGRANAKGAGEGLGPKFAYATVAGLSIRSGTSLPRSFYPHKNKN